MADNNPANDRYNPPGTMSRDYEKTSFSEINVDDLFWQTNAERENNPWRKVSQNEGMNLKTQTIHNFQPSTVVFQKI
tara:strand:+ start:154 stop:384 length:231 start_codon:yes stop_codon:yes gene_type:complete